MKRRRFLFDIESTSTVDLKTAGAAVYWAHPDTRIVCLCYRIDQGDVHVWRPGDSVPYFVPELGLGDWRIVAHNYAFEFAAWVHVLGPRHYWGPAPVLLHWNCTMARASYWGFPAGLGDACDALFLPVRKDVLARGLMLRMSRPRSLDPLTWWHETDPAKVTDLIEYCKTDVEAECALDDRLPALPSRERAIFELDGVINQRGIAVDLDMVARMARLTLSENVRLNERMTQLTSGHATTTSQVARIRDSLDRLGYPVDGLAKEIVAAAIDRLSVIPGTAAELARMILECRQEAAKSSTAKLRAITSGVSQDSRMRGLFRYYGAARTGRWSGQKFQPQNLPRGTTKNLNSIFDLVEKSPHIPARDLAPLLTGSVMTTVSDMIRGCLVASPGNTLIVGDLSQIEARVLCWLAGQNDVLDVFRSGQDVYTYAANRLRSDNRTLGKTLTLAAGFSMGPERFILTAATYGLTLTLEEAQAAVWGWRRANRQIVHLWGNVGEAAVNVVGADPGYSCRVGYLVFRRTGKAMRVVLPSGRELVYQQIEETPDELDRPSLSYMGVDPKTKQWLRIRTYGGKLVENITQAVARDVLAEGMLSADEDPMLALVGTVHDEIVAEALSRDSAPALVSLIKHMTRTPTWAPGLPIAAEGYRATRYRK